MLFRCEQKAKTHRKMVVMRNILYVHVDKTFKCQSKIKILLLFINYYYYKFFFLRTQISPSIIKIMADYFSVDRLNDKADLICSALRTLWPLSLCSSTVLN